MNSTATDRTLVRVQEEPTFFIAGATVKFVSTPEDTKANLFLMEGSILPGAFVPLHMHPDPEIFYLTDGTLEVYVDAGPNTTWETARQGDVINIPGQTKHAFRNRTDTPARSMAVSGRDIYMFFREIVEPFDPAKPPAPPTKEQMQKVIETAAKYDYWMGSPDENAAIGIDLPEPA